MDYHHHARLTVHTRVHFAKSVVEAGSLFARSGYIIETAPDRAVLDEPCARNYLEEPRLCLQPSRLHGRNRTCFFYLERPRAGHNKPPQWVGSHGPFYSCLGF